MEIEFKKIGEENIAGVLEIERLSFKNPWNRGFFEREISLEQSHFYVALIDSGVVGYGGFWKMGDEADIVNLAVHPDFRLKGIGEKIASYLIKKAIESGIGKLFLEVRESNVVAQRLYEKFGFKKVGKRKKYYCNEDAIIMETSLSQLNGIPQ